MSNELVKKALESLNPARIQTVDGKIIVQLDDGTSFRVSVETPKKFKIIYPSCCKWFNSQHPFGINTTFDTGEIIIGFVKENEIMKGYIDIVAPTTRFTMIHPQCLEEIK